MLILAEDYAEFLKSEIRAKKKGKNRKLTKKDHELVLARVQMHTFSREKFLEDALKHGIQAPIRAPPPKEDDALGFDPVAAAESVLEKDKEEE